MFNIFKYSFPACTVLKYYKINLFWFWTSFENYRCKSLKIYHQKYSTILQIRFCCSDWITKKYLYFSKQTASYYQVLAGTRTHWIGNCSTTSQNLDVVECGWNFLALAEIRIMCHWIFFTPGNFMHNSKEWGKRRSLQWNIFMWKVLCFYLLEELNSSSVLFDGWV